MPPYTLLRFAPGVEATVRQLHPVLKRRVRAAIDQMLISPEAGKSLVRELEGWRSWRVGRVRIIYRTHGTSLEIAAIGPRRSIYPEAALKVRRSVSES